MDCLICYDTINPDELITTCCGHNFHKLCIKNSILVKDDYLECPYCRTLQTLEYDSIIKTTHKCIINGCDNACDTDIFAEDLVTTKISGAIEVICHIYMGKTMIRYGEIRSVEYGLCDLSSELAKYIKKQLDKYNDYDIITDKTLVFLLI
jgi:hypothetical protein